MELPVRLRGCRTVAKQVIEARVTQDLIETVVQGIAIEDGAAIGLLRKFTQRILRHPQSLARQDGAASRADSGRRVTAGDQPTRVDRVDRRVMTVGLLRHLSQLTNIGEPAWRKPLADEDERLASLTHRSEPNGQRFECITDNGRANALGTAHLQGMLLFNGVSCCVVASSSLEALNRLQNGIVVVGEDEISHRHQRLHDGDQIVWTELADERRHRVPDRTRALAAHLVISQQDAEYPHVVSRGLTLFGVAIQYLPSM